MYNINDSNFSEAFAIAWSENQGNYSATLAKKVLNFITNFGQFVLYCRNNHFSQYLQRRVPSVPAVRLP